MSALVHVHECVGWDWRYERFLLLLLNIDHNIRSDVIIGIVQHDERLVVVNNHFRWRLRGFHIRTYVIRQGFVSFRLRITRPLLAACAGKAEVSCVDAITM